MRAVKFEIQYKDGTIHRLVGEDAEKWVDGLNGCCTVAGVHGMNPLADLDVSWEVIKGADDEHTSESE